MAHDHRAESPPLFHPDDKEGAFDPSFYLASPPQNYSHAQLGSPSMQPASSAQGGLRSESACCLCPVRGAQTHAPFPPLRPLLVSLVPTGPGFQFVLANGKIVEKSGNLADCAART